MTTKSFKEVKAAILAIKSGAKNEDNRTLDFAMRPEQKDAVNKSESVKKTKKEANERELSKQEKKELSDEEKEYKSIRKQIQGKCCP